MGEIADGLLVADDGAVRAALGQELNRLRGAEPAAALGVAAGASVDDVRARFLALVKIYHPNRFARRPPDIIKLANEVFLLLRRAHQRLGEKPRGREERLGSIPPRAADVSPPSQPRLDVDAALARRRRIRSQPVTPVGSLPPPPELVEKARRRDDELKGRFEAAVADARQGRLPGARSALRTLVAENPSARPYRAYLHYVTGRMHEIAGRTTEAIAEYDRALGFDPDLEEARRSKEALIDSASDPGDGPEREGAGRFGRWFRK